VVPAITMSKMEIGNSPAAGHSARSSRRAEQAHRLREGGARNRRHQRAMRPATCDWI
jgi:hypothetical protein